LGNGSFANFLAAISVNLLTLVLAKRPDFGDALIGHNAKKRFAAAVPCLPR
jgi:hypothetical protein